MLLLLLFFSALPIAFIFLLKMQNMCRRTHPLPPGPKGLPLIGNLHQLDISKPHICLQTLSKIYGPIMYSKLCRLPVIVISSAEVAKTALKQNDVAFAGRPFSTAWFRFSYGQSDIIGSPYTDYWRQMRKIVVHHLFSHPKIQFFHPVRQDEVSRLMAEISKKAESDQLIDVKEMALSFSHNLLFRVAVGKKLEHGGGSWKLFDKIMRQLSTALTESFLTENLLFGWINKFSGADHRVEKAFKEMDAFYQQLIDEHLSPDRPDSMKNDFLDLLIQLREDESAPVKIDWKHIKAILMNVFLGGIESTEVTIVWVMTVLMKNPSVMKKLQEEIRSVVRLKSSVDEDDIEKLPYFKAVLKETLRMYPAVPLVPKETTTMSIINGYEIEPKTLVFVNIWGICRDPEYWNNPEEFMPERFLNTTLDYKGQDFGFIPFGSGRRICPGMHFAVATTEMALSNLVYAFNWELPHGITKEDIDTDQSFGLVMHKKNTFSLLAKPIHI